MDRVPLVSLPQSKPRVEEIELLFPSFTPGDDLRLVLLADLHIRNSTNLRQIFAVIERLSPSLLFLLGDYFLTYKRAKVEEFFSLLSQINPPLGKFAIPGNRDRADFLPYLFLEAGVIFLRDEYALRKNHNSTLLISGVRYESEDISSLLRSLPSADFSILLSHKPDIILSPGDWKKVNLVLSGHTHGGQIRFPLLGAILTKSKLSRKYASGLANVLGLHLYVSRGIGVSKIPLRFACPSEISLLKIRGNA